ncbi:MAG TPA: glycosyltransferase [Roseiflexaceae bacterium]|nr:glycosyltransferase [Roseiflexaceae bacterium]
MIRLYSQAEPQQRGELPFVSVVIPVLNNEGELQRCLAALERQTYPGDRYEVIVVDNGSARAIAQVAGGYQHVQVAREVQSGAYAARNKGLTLARGDIIAFTDSDCTPSPEWLAQGVRALEAHEADLVGGHVRFSAPQRLTGADVYDMIAHLRVDRYIHEERAAVTANLFVRAGVFEKIGTFSLVKSGGDILFTRRATSAGHRLVYAPAAEVLHPTRQLNKLLRKQFQVGKGHRAIRLAQRLDATQSLSGASVAPTKRHTKLHRLARTLKGMLPMPFTTIMQGMREQNLPLKPMLVARVWVVAWLARVAKTAGGLSIFN